MKNYTHPYTPVPLTSEIGTYCVYICYQIGLLNSVLIFRNLASTEKTLNLMVFLLLASFRFLSADTANLTYCIP